MGGWPGQFLDLPALGQGPGQLGGLADDARWKNLAIAVRILRVHELGGCQKRLPRRGGRHCRYKLRRDALLLRSSGSAKAKGLRVGDGGDEQRDGE